MGVAKEVRARGPAGCDMPVKTVGGFARVPRVNAFHVCGVLFAAWALILSLIGITREHFPSSAGTGRLVGAVTVILCLATIGTAIFTAAGEEHESEEEHASLAGS
jgi:hypothetical protein